ncbi:hypothetical protein RB594_002304 [Gaeumannomyces avenae]
MRLIIRDDEERASRYVANYIVERINHFQPTAAHPFVLGLPTGSSPLGVYRTLVEKYKAGEVSFENVVTFNMDEYIGIPRDHPESYHTFMWKHFFSHVNVDPTNVHILDGNAPNLEAECVEYEAAIRRAGGIDLFLAGIGEDGHIAFNEPGSSLASRTRVKTLAYDTILANSRFFGNDLDAVPKMALTVGVQTVLEAREVVVIILGARKALALQRCIEQGVSPPGPARLSLTSQCHPQARLAANTNAQVNHMWTLSSLQLHPHPMIVCDEDATLELQVKTVKVRCPLRHHNPKKKRSTNPAPAPHKQYFKSIEQVATAQGFEQILPSKVRTGTVPITPKAVVIESPTSPTAPPTLVAPQPRMAHSLAPYAEYPVRSVSPDLVPDRMASRIPGEAGAALNRRLTPNPEQQQQQQPRDSAPLFPHSANAMPAPISA